MLRWIIVVLHGTEVSGDRGDIPREPGLFCWDDCGACTGHLLRLPNGQAFEITEKAELIHDLQGQWDPRKGGVLEAVRVEAA